MRYEINPILSRIRLKVYASGLLSALGHSPTIVVRNFSGHVVVPDAPAGASAMTLSIPAAGLAVGDDVKASDRREIDRVMQTDVLEVTAYPSITFVATEATGVAPGPGSFSAAITGTLTLHGVSRPERIEALVNVLGDRLTASGQGVIRQSDYGIKPVSIAGGALKLKDEIDLSFDIVARVNQ